MIINRILGPQGFGGRDDKEWHAEHYGWICHQCGAYTIRTLLKLSIGDMPNCPYCKTKALNGDRPIDEIVDDPHHAVKCPRCESYQVYSTMMGPRAWNHATCTRCKALWNYRQNLRGEWEISYTRV